MVARGRAGARTSHVHYKCLHTSGEPRALAEGDGRRRRSLLEALEGRGVGAASARAGGGKGVQADWRE